MILNVRETVGTGILEMYEIHTKLMFQMRS